MRRNSFQVDGRICRYFKRTNGDAYPRAEGVVQVGIPRSDRGLGGNHARRKVEGSKVHFEVTLIAAERAGLKISSKLLNLAKIVRDQEGKGGS